MEVSGAGRGRRRTLVLEDRVYRTAEDLNGEPGRTPLLDFDRVQVSTGGAGVPVRSLASLRIERARRRATAAIHLFEAVRAESVVQTQRAEVFATDRADVEPIDLGDKPWGDLVGRIVAEIRLGAAKRQGLHVLGNGGAGDVKTACPEDLEEEGVDLLSDGDSQRSPLSPTCRRPQSRSP